MLEYAQLTNCTLRQNPLGNLGVTIYCTHKPTFCPFLHPSLCLIIHQPLILSPTNYQDLYIYVSNSSEKLIKSSLIINIHLHSKFINPKKKMVFLITFPTVNKCSSTGRENHTVVSDMDGTLLRGRSSFPYFALVAFEVGGVLRLLLLLLASPLAGLLYYFISESAGIQVLIFVTFAGMRVSDIESVARAVLPKFYSSDVHPESWRVFSSCGKRCVVTANPRIMVEAFLKEFVGADMVLGTEIETYKGRATGLVRRPGVLVGKNKANAIKKAFGDTKPEIGLGDRLTDVPYMTICKVHIAKKQY